MRGRRFVFILAPISRFSDYGARINTPLNSIRIGKILPSGDFAYFVLSACKETAHKVWAQVASTRTIVADLRSRDTIQKLRDWSSIMTIH